MANRQKSYIVFDCETATLPFVGEIANGNADVKKKLAIAKPLIYDCGWTRTNRKGELIVERQFLVAETFAVPSIFNTAYYAEKRPIYLEKLSRGEITIKPWNEIMEIFISDLEQVDAVGAFNSMFDFKKAIPFTELYISKLYSPEYQEWENIQRRICARIATEKNNKSNPNFESDVFRFRGKEYNLFDLWGLATTHLLDNATYKSECLKHNLLTASGTFFKSSAESTYQYLCDKYDFVEAHTALEDAIIETFILSKIAQRHAITNGIKFFPFRDLGYTSDFVMRRKVPNMDEVETVYNAINSYVEAKVVDAGLTPYISGLINKLERLANYAGIECSWLG